MRGTLSGSRAALAMLAIVLAPVRAMAQPYYGLGTFAGCSIYACHEFTLREVARSEPVLPRPNAEAAGVDYPQNVPSYLVTYEFVGRSTLRQPAVDLGLASLSADAHIAVRDGEFGETFMTPIFSFSVVGRVAGDVIDWSSLATADLWGYLPIAWPVGTSAITFEAMLTDLPIGDGGWFPPDAEPSDYAVAQVSSVSAPEPTTRVLLAVGLVLLIPGVLRLPLPRRHRLGYGRRGSQDNRNAHASAPQRSWLLGFL